MFTCPTLRSWSGLRSLPQSFIIASRLVLLGRALLPHDPLPGPRQSGVTCNTLHIALIFFIVFVLNMILTVVLTVRVRGEPSHSPHRPVSKPPEETGCQGETGPGHRCGLLPAGADVCY